MNTFFRELDKNLNAIQKILLSEDILTYSFKTEDGVPCALLYADGIVNKQLLGDLIARPISKLSLHDKIDKANAEKPQNDGGRYEFILETMQKTALFPELKTAQKQEDGIKEILDGNTLFLIDGIDIGLVVGAKLLPVRTIMEPPTDVTVKGPREGFIEDIKVNMSLVRKRLKTPALRFETLRIGKQSDTAVTLCYLDKTCKTEIKDEIKKRIERINVDCIPDSSYIGALISPRRHSLFKTVGTTEKPDVFTAKLSEGRVGILVDGSPIALTVPFILTEDLQSSEDYFVSPFVATITRSLRMLALFVGILLPALYVAAQLFKMQIFPLSLTLTIASSVRELPLSPSLEMFVVLFLLEVLKEASIRMPKYVGMSLSVVGALVLGETAVSAGFLSTPAIIIVAFSGICLYTVPNFVETGSVLRWLFLLVAGCVGTLGIALLVAFLFVYLLSTDIFGAPLLAPFSPLIGQDLRDSVVKYDIAALPKRPKTYRSNNKTRFSFHKQSQKEQTK